MVIIYTEGNFHALFQCLARASAKYSYDQCLAVETLRCEGSGRTNITSTRFSKGFASASRARV